MHPTTHNYNNFILDVLGQMKENVNRPSMQGELILAQRKLLVEAISSGCSDSQLARFLDRAQYFYKQIAIYKSLDDQEELKAAFEKRKLTHIRQPSTLSEFQDTMKGYGSMNVVEILNTYAYAFAKAALENDRQTVKLLLADLIGDPLINKNKIYFFLLNNPVDYLLEDATICSLFEAHRGEDLNTFFLNESATREPVDFDQIAQSWNNQDDFAQLLTLDRLLHKKVPFREISARLFDIDPTFSFGCKIKSISSNGRRYDVYGFSEVLFDEKHAFYIPGV